MSAILGRLNFNSRPIDPLQAEAALDQIRPYGPDGEGAVTRGPVTLAQCCKAITRHGAAQGNVAELGTRMCVADVLLDNRTDLIGKLGISTSKAATLADDALILRAFARWGRACTDHLVGDYAFAVWDNDARSLFMARDAIGTRPLYWRRDGPTFVFASDVRALVQFDDLSWDIDPTVVAQYLAQPLFPVRRGFFRGVEMCQPGGFVAVSEDNVRTGKWWDVASGVAERFKKPADYALRLRELLDDATASMVDTDLPVGSHLSGGLDSTGVTCVAQKQLRTQGRALEKVYTWAPPVSKHYPDMGKKDERRVIRALSERDGFEIHWGEATVRDLLALIKRPMEFEGTADLADELPVLRRATNDGIGVMLSGWGGDEGFSAKGHGVISGLVRQGRLLKALDTLRGPERRRNPAYLARNFWDQGVKPLLPPGWTPDLDVHQSGIDCLRHVAEWMPDQYEVRLTGRSAVNRVGARSVLMGMLEVEHIPARMETWAHWSKGNFQYRYPLCSRAIFEFMAQVPDWVHFGDGRARYLARTALAPHLAGRHSKFDNANEANRSRLMAGVVEHIQANRLTDLDDNWLPSLEIHLKIEKSREQHQKVAPSVVAELLFLARAAQTSPTQLGTLARLAPLRYLFP
ncbi:asparagine synthetase B family protein [Sulfitobacter sp. JB4-11]|uniref:asparagine synthetase B family protein n=1 Tax=Sulfitobacter rhodophyticola TaxID=3238304 RepID=UPI0035168C2D